MNHEERRQYLIHKQAVIKAAIHKIKIWSGCDRQTAAHALRDVISRSGASVEDNGTVDAAIRRAREIA